MSDGSVEVIRQAAEHISKTGELDEGCYDPDVEYKTQPDGPLRTTYRGLPGLRRSLESLKEAWAEMKIEAREFIETDDAVVVVLSMKLRGHSGIELEVDQGWAVWMRDGKIWRVEQYASKQEALKAAGQGGGAGDLSR
jgi:ketosteroid isomerase-like protein